MDSHRRQLSASALAWGLGLGALPGLARAGQRREPLIVWFTVEGAKGMRRVAEAFTRDTGVPVVVETPDPQDGPSKFQQASSAGKGPDIYIYAHDRVGEWVAGGLLHEVHPSRRLRQDIAALGWQGFTWRGRQWGYPIALEAITLIYNKALVSRPPASFDEIITLDDQLARQGKRAILWDYTNNYFTWPLLAANGGYPFKARADGSYDVRDVGIDHPGAVQGAELLARLIREGRMPAGATYPDMEAAMAQGRVAMMLNGPWSWVNLQRAGIDFGVARLPRVGQKPAVPFVGVKGMMINRATRQRELAVAFIEDYLLTVEGLRHLNDAEPLGAPASQAFYAQLAQDPKIAGIMDSALQGVPTPAVPEMGRFWSSMKTSLLNLTEGRQNAADAMRSAARRVRDAG